MVDAKDARHPFVGVFRNCGSYPSGVDRNATAVPLKWHIDVVIIRDMSCLSADQQWHPVPFSSSSSSSSPPPFFFFFFFVNFFF
jgi:hypothetical protein